MLCVGQEILTHEDARCLRPGDIISWQHLGAIVQEVPELRSYIHVYSSFCWPIDGGKLVWHHVAQQRWESPSSGTPVILRSRALGGFTVIGDKIFKFDGDGITYNGYRTSLIGLRQETQA